MYDEVTFGLEDELEDVFLEVVVFFVDEDFFFVAIYLTIISRVL